MGMKECTKGGSPIQLDENQGPHNIGEREEIWLSTGGLIWEKKDIAVVLFFNVFYESVENGNGGGGVSVGNEKAFEA